MARILLDGYTSVVQLEEDELLILADIWLVRCPISLLMHNCRVSTGLEPNYLTNQITNCFMNLRQVRCAIELLTYNSRVDTGLEAPERGAPDARRFVVQLEALLALSGEARAWLLSSPGPSCSGGSTPEALRIRRDAAIGPGSEAVSYADDPVHALRAAHALVA
jgi:hypothetical protein